MHHILLHPSYLQTVKLFIQLLQSGVRSTRGTKLINLQQADRSECLLVSLLAYPCLYIEVSELAVLWENENLKVLDFSHNSSNWNTLIIIVSTSLLLLL